MSDGAVGVTFSVPYEIASVRPLRQTSLQERERALKACANYLPALRWMHQLQKGSAGRTS